MSNKPLFVSVIIPHYNDLEALDRCLTTLERQSYPAMAREIIVADNDSPAGAERVAQVIDGRARLVIAHERGAGPARNVGVAAATGTVLAFIDSDCTASPGWLEAGVAALDRANIIGGKVEVTIDPTRPMTGAEAFERLFAFDNESYVRDKGFTGSGNLFCARADFDRVGGFSVGVSEDLEWCHRASARGLTLAYSGAAAIGHPARPDWFELKRKWKRINAESFGLVQNKPLGRLTWLLRTWLLPVSIVVHMGRVLTSPLLPDWQTRLRAGATLTRIRLWRFIDAHRLLVTKAS